MKKMLQLLLPFLACTTFAFADSEIEECNSCCCTRSCWEDVSRWCDCGIDYFVTADFIYWGAKEDGLEFAATYQFNAVLESTVGKPGSTTPSVGRSYRPGWNWDPGFKVGAGLEFCGWGWDLYAQYTWLHVGKRKSANGGSTLALRDAYWLANETDHATPTSRRYDSAKSNWRFHLNVLDIDLGRAFYIGEQIMFRPHAGLKWAWNKDRFDLRFINRYDSATSTTIDGPGQFCSNLVKIWGVGIRGGLDGVWHFTREFSLIGAFDLTGLWEHVKASRQDVNAGNALSTLNNLDKYSIIEPVFEWSLGFRWETWWCCDRYHFAIDANWESQVWINQNRFIHIIGTAPITRDLMLQGATLSTRFDF